MYFQNLWEMNLNRSWTTNQARRKEQMGQNGYCNFLNWCPLAIYNSLCLLILAKIVQCRIRFSNLPGEIYYFLISSFDKEGNSEVSAFLFA